MVEPQNHNPRRVNPQITQISPIKNKGTLIALSKRQGMRKGGQVGPVDFRAMLSVLDSVSSVQSVD